MKLSSASVKIEEFYLDDDGIFPNSRLPLLIYRQVWPAEKAFAADMEKTFKQNNWWKTWRDGVYPYHHYHSTAHEVLGIYKGEAVLQFGNSPHCILLVKRGDVILVPAGVAHKNMDKGVDFKCVGAYPHGQDYDMNYGKEGERPEADANIHHLPLPATDPVFGKRGPLLQYWKAEEDA